MAEPDWDPDEWVCSHHQRRYFESMDAVFEHLGCCYVDSYGRVESLQDKESTDG